MHAKHPRSHKARPRWTAETNALQLQGNTEIQLSGDSPGVLAASIRVLGFQLSSLCPA